MLHRYLIVLGATAGVAACSDVQQPLKVPNPSRSVSGSGGFQFTPLASSAVCTPGGNPNAPFIVPAGFTQTIVASEPDVPDAIDMNTQNETGPHAGRYLYRPAEGSIGAVTVTDLETGVTKQLAFHPDWAEPTGLYFDIRGWGLFVNAQHRGGDHLDKAVLITRSGN